MPASRTYARAWLGLGLRSVSSYPPPSFDRQYQARCTTYLPHVGVKGPPVCSSSRKIIKISSLPTSNVPFKSHRNDTPSFKHILKLEDASSRVKIVKSMPPLAARPSVLDSIQDLGPVTMFAFRCFSCLAEKCGYPSTCSLDVSCIPPNTIF
ncbi:hypothetical protein C8R45DRAFT_1014020 [Mycena sanguinolenta]|nr:hypothetical protein C8R45DRAFT_1014020 [Mycena sanguinolenta]